MKTINDLTAFCTRFDVMMETDLDQSGLETEFESEPVAEAPRRAFVHPKTTKAVRQPQVGDIVSYTAMSSNRTAEWRVANIAESGRLELKGFNQKKKGFWVNPEACTFRRRTW